MSATDFDPELEDLQSRSVGKLMSAEQFDAAAFERLYEHLSAKAELIKGEHVISKQVVNCVFELESAISSRAEYLPSAKEGLPLISKFLGLLHLMAIGESPSDRVPGQPRII